jgi:hypothetical protein
MHSINTGATKFETKNETRIPRGLEVANSFTPMGILIQIEKIPDRLALEEVIAIRPK